MPWGSLVLSIPYLLVVFLLIRHINLERDANVKERSMLISHLLNRPAPAQGADQSFIPLDDPRISGMLDHLRGSQSTVGDVEGSETQP
jgi:hypothetical protein